MRRQDRALVALLVTVAATGTLLTLGAATAEGIAEPQLLATPQAECGPGSNPETDLQGRVPAADHDSGRVAEGYSCNAERIGTISDDLPVGTEGGFKVQRYVDASGRECGYYDSTLLLGTDVLDLLDFDDLVDFELSELPDLLDGKLGVHVVDMSDPTQPTITDSLITPAMLSPHESMLVSTERGLLMATLGNPAANVGLLDIYDISEDCRHPQLLSTGPAGIIGHESGLSPDGMTFYSASPGTRTLFAVDISNPRLPIPLTGFNIDSHGLSISADGNLAYVASLDGLDILDVSSVQSRDSSPQIEPVGSLDWTSRSIPQNAIPITIDGHHYVVEIDEFGSGSAVGAGRIIDVEDPTDPFVLSNLRLEVHQPEHFATIADDVGNQSPIQGYAGHYCNVPTRVDPTIVACSMIMSGLRVFSIVDPANPVEIAYFNAPSDDVPLFGGNYAMSMPEFAPERNEIWYSDGFTGFHVIRLTNDVWPVRAAPTGSPSAPTSTAAQVSAEPASGLPATGGRVPLSLVVIAIVAGLAATGVVAGGRRPGSASGPERPTPARRATKEQ